MSDADTARERKRKESVEEPFQGRGTVIVTRCRGEEETAQKKNYGDYMADAEVFLPKNRTGKRRNNHGRAADELGVRNGTEGKSFHAAERARNGENSKKCAEEQCENGRHHGEISEREQSQARNEHGREVHQMEICGVAFLVLAENVICDGFSNLNQDGNQK